MLVCAPDKPVGASMASTFRHGIQPGGLVLLSDALGHRSQIFRVDPAIIILKGVQGPVSIRRNIGVKDDGVIVRFLSSCISHNVKSRCMIKFFFRFPGSGS